MYKCVALPSPLDPIDHTFIVASCEPRTVSRLTVSHSIAPSASTLTTLPAGSGLCVQGKIPVSQSITNKSSKLQK